MINILDLTLDELSVWMKNNGEKPFRAKQIVDWIYKGIWDFENMKNISKGCVELLKNNFYVGIPEIVEKLISKKDNTVKLLLRLRDGNVIECVIMPYKHGNSICVSTQVGCRMGCKFCASTIGGRVRDLTSGEILGEILVAQKLIGERISNIVLMGSGEPLDNYENVIKFLRVVNADYGLNIGARHITLSTCGLIPEINRLSQEDMQITLAISLHAPNDNIRKQSMPIANKYSIEEIINACKTYINKTNRRITFEYALIKGLNDGENHAKELSDLLKGLLCHVNLIPVNEVKENEFTKPNNKEVEKFKSILEENGVETTIRREMGSDINAACGQLRKTYIENNHS